MPRLYILFLTTLFLSGCMNSLGDARSYNGLDSSYTSSRSAQDTAECIKKGWQGVFSADPSRVWLTEKDKDGSLSVYTPAFLYLADVKPVGNVSTVNYYHNGDRLWGTKQKLTGVISRCL